MSYTDVKNLPSTVLSLNRSYGEGQNRDQSFSVSRKSLRVKTSQVDKRMLSMRTDADKMAKAASMKRQNNRQPADALQRIEHKLLELGTKLIKAIRKQTDTTAIDALILRCQYYRHREVVRLAELNVKADERAVIQEALMLPSNEVPVFERPIIPASVGRTYKAGRKVLKDRIVRHGPAEIGHVAIKRSKPRKAKKAKSHKGVGSY